jgi:2',3'-cyclic-nucleotide 2'-phosphodiesterase/3'-nucleotidase
MSRRTVLGAGLSVGAAMMPRGRAQAARTGEPPLTLRILSTTDLHAALKNWDYVRDREDPSVGLDCVATLLAAARAEVADSILVDCGDVLQGSPLADWVAFQRGLKPGDVHPAFAAMDLLGYDAGTLGNHEFDYGLDFLDICLAKAPFPFVSTNLSRVDGSPYVSRSLILERRLGGIAGAAGVPIRIGLLGFLPPQTMIWDKGYLEGQVLIDDIVASAEDAVPALREAGADIVVVLSHSGIVREDDPLRTSENAALALARIEGIDAIVSGHQHLVFPGPDFAGIPGVDTTAGTLLGVPSVMAGFWGSHLGIIDLTLAHDDAGWHVEGARSEVRPIARRDADGVSSLAAPAAAIDAVIEEAHQATRRYVAQPIGETTRRIASHWARIADDAGVQIVNAAQADHARAFLAGTSDETLPLLSASAPYRTGGRAGPDAYVDIPAGPITLRSAADLYPHPNQVVAVRIDGAALRDWLEFSAGLFNRIDPASTAPQPLIDPTFPIANFDVIDGVSYRIDVTQPRRFDPDGRVADAGASRIRDLSWNLAPVGDDDLFVVVTNNFRVAGGGNVPGMPGATQIFVSPNLTRDVLTRWIFEQGTIDPVADHNWSIVPLPDTVVATYETAPAGAGTVPRGINATPIGPTPEGFMRFRVSFGS